MSLETYQLSFSDKALKSLKKIANPDAKKIISALEQLAQDPDKKQMLNG